uniref:Immunoglobulin V-set domain-containing protein n=1 Tax=Sander lucioperca TaxID=283035 RepID=A0A8C9X8P0_SANLU
SGEFLGNNLCLFCINLCQPSDEQTLPYPYPDPEELRVTLLKGLHGTQELCSSTLSFTEQTEPGVAKEREVQCSARLREGSVEVTVSGLKATDTDLYRCGIEIFYPPPYLRLTGNGTLIHVLGKTPTRDLQFTHWPHSSHICLSSIQSSFLFIHFLCSQAAPTVPCRRLTDRLHSRAIKERTMRRG